MKKKNFALCKISLLSLSQLALGWSHTALASHLSPVVSNPRSFAVDEAPVPESGASPEILKWKDRNSTLPLKQWQPYLFPKEEKVTVTFEIDLAGFVQKPKLERSAWDIDVDASCLESCLTASSFKPIPKRFKYFAPPGFDHDQDELFQAVFNHSQIKDWFTGAVDYYKQNPDKAKTTFALHAVPLYVTEAYPQTFTRAELSGTDNVLTIPKNRDTYEADIKIYCGCWQQFFLQHATASRQEILQLRDTLKKDLPRMLIPQPPTPISSPQL